jgi:hypothetical protein
VITKVANWVAGVVLPLLLAAGCVVDSVASAQTFALLDGPVELWRETESGLERARPAPAAGQGVPFGYRISYEVGEEGVVCVGRFARYQCEGGWRLAPIRAAGGG